jgi:hypothetical protein
MSVIAGMGCAALVWRFWSYPLKGSDEQLVQAVVRSAVDNRDALIIGLGHRGPRAIPAIVDGYEHAKDDRTLRIQLVTALYRTGPGPETRAALQALADKETDPQVADVIGNDLMELDRHTRGST